MATAYPLSAYESLRQEKKECKIVHLIRHAQGKLNVYSVILRTSLFLLWNDDSKTQKSNFIEQRKKRKDILNNDYLIK